MTTRFNVLISDKFPQAGLDVLMSGNKLNVDCRYELNQKDLKQAIRDYDGLIVRSMTTVTDQIIGEAARLRVIGRAGVGLDNIDLKAARDRGIAVLNVPSANTVSTAEHTLGLILSLARHIPQANASVKSGRWERSAFKGVELKGKTLGLIGCGQIGSTVAGYARALGMRVVAYDPYLTGGDLPSGLSHLIGFEDLLRCSDFISLHVPLTQKTNHMISTGEFGLMKRGVRLVNCARGGIIDEPALVDALESGKVSACGLDVFEQEPVSHDSRLRAFNNCIVTPHIGAATSEAQVNVAIDIAGKVKRALLGEGNN